MTTFPVNPSGSPKPAALLTQDPSKKGAVDETTSQIGKSLLVNPTAPEAPKKLGFIGKMLAKGAQFVVNKFVHITPEQKAQIIDEARAVIKARTKESQHVFECLDIVKNLVKGKIVDSLINSFPEGSDEQQYILPQRPFLHDLIEVNFEQGFANLITQVEANKADIPNYAHQPLLASILSYLCQNGGKRINAKGLKEVEEKYRKNRQEMAVFKQKLSSNMKPQINELVKGYIKEADLAKRAAIEAKLKSELAGQPAKEAADFMDTLLIMRERRRDLHALFHGMTEDILSCLFPRKFDDMQIKVPSILNNRWNLYETFVHGTMTDIVLDNYDSLEIDLNHKSQWESVLQSIIGTVDIQPVIQSPSSLLVEYAKNAIQTNPQIVSLTASAIDSLHQSDLFLNISEQNKVKKSLAVHLKEDQVRALSIKQLIYASKLSAVQLKKLSLLSEEFFDKQLLIDYVEINLKNQPLDNLSLEQLERLSQLDSGTLKIFSALSREEFEQQLAQQVLLPKLSERSFVGWVIDSAQAVLNTKDTDLLKMGHFFRERIEFSTLGLLAKLLQWFIPKGDHIPEDEFLHKLMDRVLEKIHALQGKETLLSDEFWAELLTDLSIPQMAKDLLLPFLIQKGKALQLEIQKRNPDLIKLDDVYVKSAEKIRTFEGGAELLSILDKVTNLLVKKVLEKNVELVETFGLDESMDGFFAQFLPGIVIDEKLIEWFKKNVTGLKKTKNGLSSKSVESVKQGIETVLRTALINTMETNFKNNSKDYAAQFLGNIHKAFRTAFVDVQKMDKETLDEAMKFYADKQAKLAQIKALKKQMSFKDRRIDPQQALLIERMKKAHIRFVNASKYMENLLSSKEALLNQLYKECPALSLGDQTIDLVALSLDRLKNNAENADSVKNKIDELRKRKNDPGAARMLSEAEVLYALLKMTPQSLQLISTLLATESTLQNSKQEWSLSKEEFKACEDAADKHNPDLFHNEEAWKLSLALAKGAVENRKTILELSLEVEKDEAKIDALIGPFQVLSKELSFLLGLDNKDKLALPQDLKDSLWPLIESSKKRLISEILFSQITPMILPILESDKTRQKLEDLLDGDPFVGKLAHAAAIDTIEHIPEFVTSYKPFAAQALKIIETHPTDENIAKMESALYLTMIQLGKSEVKASMIEPLIIGKVPEDKVDAITPLLVELIAKSGTQKLAQNDLHDLLKKEIKPESEEEIADCEKSARLVTESLNDFLLYRGKQKMEAKDLFNIYQGQIAAPGSGVPLNQELIIEALQSSGIVEKIKRVVITPEEIALLLNNFIPGAKDLHHLIAPQLQAVITGEDKSFKDNREILQRYIEGLLLRVFVKAGQANHKPGENILTVLTRKLADIPLQAGQIKNKCPEEAAREMVDKVLKDVLGISSSDYFQGIPAALQKTVYDKLKEQCYKHMTVLIVPMIEREKNRELMEKESGSSFLGNLCKALSRDALSVLPGSVCSYRIVSERILRELSGKAAEAEQIAQFSEEIAQFVKKSKKDNVTNHFILDTYLKITKQQATAKQKKTLKSKIVTLKVRKEIRNIEMTPEAIVETLCQLGLRIDAQFQSDFANQLQKLFHERPDIYQNGSEFVQAYIEGVLLKVFLKIVKINPPKDGKDTLIVLTENLLAIATDKYQALKKRLAEEASNAAAADPAKAKPIDLFAKELNNSVLEALGIGSFKALEGLPDPLKPYVYARIKNLIGEEVLRIHHHLAQFETGSAPVKEALENSKKYNVPIEKDKNGKPLKVAEKGKPAESNLKILADDLSRMVMATIPSRLAKKGQDKPRVVNFAGKAVENYLEDLSRGNLSVAQLLLKYPKTGDFQQMLGDNYTKAADKNALPEEKKMAAEMLSNILLVFLNKTAEKAVAFEKDRGEQFNKKLMGHVLEIAAGHLKNLNLARKKAPVSQALGIRHQDFVDATDKLDPAVPKSFPTFQKSLDLIGQKIFGMLTPDQQFATGKVFADLTPAQEALWLNEQAELRKLFEKMGKEEGKGDRIISLKELVGEISKSALKVTGQPLSKDQRKALKAALDDNGTTLKDLVREEAFAVESKSGKSFYYPAVKKILKMLFPNGKQDLVFLPEELRTPLWRLFKDSLFPTVLSTITELMIEPDLINKMVLASLKKVHKTLNEKIVPGGPVEDPKLPLDELDLVSGELMKESLEAIELPSWAKKMLMDPKKPGEISDSMKKTMGAVLRKQFNETFIAENMALGIEFAVERTEGDYMLNVDTATRTSKEKADLKAKTRAKMQKDLKQISRQVVDAGISYYIRSRWVEAQYKFDQGIEKIFGKVGKALKKGLDLFFRWVFIEIIGRILAVLLWPVKALAKLAIYKKISLDKNREQLLGLVTTLPPDQPKHYKYAIHNQNLIFKIGRLLSRSIQEAVAVTP